MAAVINFYLDDSGTRHPDRGTTENTATRDWFSLGGVLIAESDEAVARKMYEQFCGEWGITYPLHSVEIRHQSGNFQWLRSLPEKDHFKFLGRLEKFLLGLPVMGLACVIDRPGYNHRYLEKYGRKRWSLCKTAFSVVVERASKWAAQYNFRVRVMAERCDPKSDKKLQEYYENLKETGGPFAKDTSAKYAPLKAGDFASILYEFRLKKKSSPLMQVADMYLWPMCMGGYHKGNHPYRSLVNAGRLVDCVCDPGRVGELGIKYSCFDLVKQN